MFSIQREKSIPDGRSERGAVSAEYAIGFVFFAILLLLGINVAFAQYAQGAVRGAAEEGARAGAPFGRSDGECQKVAIETFDQLLGGSYGQNVGFQCIDDGETMRAIAIGELEPWIGIMPTIQIDLEVVVSKEPEL